MLKKAIYYPNVTYQEKLTPFGSIETTKPKLYEKAPCPNNNIINVLRIDLLACLKPLWGANILMSRDSVYKVVSGACSDQELKKALKSLALAYTGYVNYCDKQYLFGNKNRSIITNIIEPIRQRIESYYDYIVLNKEGAYKILMRTHEYVYIGSPKRIDVDYDEVKVIYNV